MVYTGGFIHGEIQNNAWKENVIVFNSVIIITGRTDGMFAESDDC